jgi:DNA-binding Xre family transcriptional regulator
MKWNLRFVAAQREIWRASDLSAKLGERGLVISAGKMSGLWSGHPRSIKLDDLDVICAVLNCDVSDLLVPEVNNVPAPLQDSKRASAQATGRVTGVIPRRRDGRTLPPE